MNKCGELTINLHACKSSFYPVLTSFLCPPLPLPWRTWKNKNSEHMLTSLIINLFFLIHQVWIIRSQKSAKPRFCMKEGRIILKKNKRNRFWFLGITYQQKQFNVLFLNQLNVSKYRTLLSPVLKFVILRLCTYTIVFINVFQTPIQQLFRFERIYVRYVSVIFILSVLTRLIHPCS